MSYRSISLINCIHKLLDSILYERFLTILEKTPILTNEFNFAYRSGLSCASSYHILKDFLNLTSKNKEKDYLVFNMDYEGAFDNIAASYLISFLTYLNFPKNFILYFSKLASLQSAILKNFWSKKIGIFCGTAQGSPISGPLFCLVVLPISLLIKKSTTLSPYRLSSLKINDDHPETFFSFPTQLSFSDDILVMSAFSINDDGSSPQIDFILKTLSDFAKFSSLKLNLSKCGLISAVESNEKIDELCNRYGLKNLSNDVQTYLGFHFLPTDVMSNKYSLDFLRDKLSKLAGNFRQAGLSGRKLLSQSFLASTVQYQTQSWHNLRVSDVQKYKTFLINVSGVDILPIQNTCPLIKEAFKWRIYTPGIYPQP